MVRKIFFVILFLAMAASAMATEWKLRRDSSAEVRIGVGGLTKATGWFLAQPDGRPSVQGRIYVDSSSPGRPRIIGCDATVSTRTAKASLKILDDLIRGEWILDADHYPQIEFECFPGASAQPDEQGNFQLSGNLHVKDQVRPFTVSATISPWPLFDPNAPVRVVAKATVNRHDFGITGGSLNRMLGNYAEITLRLVGAPEAEVSARRKVAGGSNTSH